MGLPVSYAAQRVRPYEHIGQAVPGAEGTAGWRHGTNGHYANGDRPVVTCHQQDGSWSVSPWLAGP